MDGKNVFQFVDRGIHKHIAVNSKAKLVDTDIDAADRAVEVCPTGSILRKRTGYQIPIGARLYDINPIGSDIEEKNTTTKEQE